MHVQMDSVKESENSSLLLTRDLNFWGFDELSHPINGIMATEFRWVLFFALTLQLQRLFLQLLHKSVAPQQLTVVKYRPHICHAQGLTTFYMVLIHFLHVVFLVRPVDCFTKQPLQFLPGFTNKTIYGDCVEAGWAWFPFNQSFSNFWAPVGHQTQICLTV